jgi:hypothetical protein
MGANLSRHGTAQEARPSALKARPGTNPCRSPTRYGAPSSTKSDRNATRLGTEVIEGCRVRDVVFAPDQRRDRARTA